MITSVKHGPIYLLLLQFVAFLVIFNLATHYVMAKAVSDSMGIGSANGIY